MAIREISWSPLAVWGTADPDPLSQVARAFIIGDICYFYYQASGTDGNAASSIALPLPTRPADINANLAVEGYVTIDGVDADLQPYVDMLDNTAANRYVESNSFTALTNAKAWQIVITGWYELEGGDVATFSPTLTYGTATPATQTTVSRFLNLEGVIHFLLYNTSADAQGVCSSLTSTLPTGILDLSTYVPLTGYDICVAGDDSVDYDNMMPLLDCDHATEGSRTAVSNAIGVVADNKAITCFWSGIYEQIGWGAFTPTLTFTGTTPTAAATVGRFRVVDGMCFFNVYYKTLDGNGCTDLVISGLPVDPAYLGCEIALASLATINTTDTDPLAFIAADQQAAGDRTIQFKNPATMTDATAAYIYVAGFYPVG